MSSSDNKSEIDFDAVDKIAANLSQEFLVDAADTLGQLGILVSETIGGNVDGGYALSTIRREMHTLKGLGSSFGYPSLSVIAHRLENYMLDLETLEKRQLEDILKFLDRMQEIAENGDEPDDERVSQIVRALPAKGAAKEDFQAVSDQEILLIAGSRIVGLAVEGELAKRGYRVVTIDSPIAAFEMAIRTRPDMIIASALMDKISGVDLARALKAMTPTRDIPFALLTSFDASHPELRNLPEDVALVHHDRDINAELDDVMKTCLS